MEWSDEKQKNCWDVYGSNWPAHLLPRSLYQKLVTLVSIGLLVLLIESRSSDFVGIEPNDQDLQFYPEELLTSDMADEIDTKELLHLSLLHEACMQYKDSVIPWTYGLHGKVASPDDTIIDGDDPNLLEKIRQCPDIDIFLPRGIRGDGYCEDAMGYTKYLQSRVLPLWAVTMQYEDKKTGEKFTYHDLCPKTPMIFMNHYWDGITDLPEWPKNKLVYLMPNIEMFELEAKDYWRVDVVLCKTAICARRVNMWYLQEGNPRNTRVIYTRHTSSDVATYAKNQLGSGGYSPKNFSKMEFIHTAGKSVEKGTKGVLDCWLSRPDFPPLSVFIDRDSYNANIREEYGVLLKQATDRINMNIGRVEANVFGKMIAEAAFILCTSVQEGYGHYINQARANGAVIISTNLPPMNELLSKESAILLPPRRWTIQKQLLGGRYDGEHGLKDVKGLSSVITGPDICDAVEKVLAMTEEQREAMAARARKQYLVDTRFFAAKMKELRAFTQSETRLQ